VKIFVMKIFDHKEHKVNDVARSIFDKIENVF